MNYLITGGLGYIGSHLAKTLIAQGNHVTIIDNATAHELNVYEKARIALERLPKNIISIEDARDMRSDILRGIDCVIHLAALSGIEACENNIHGAKMSNVELTKHVLAKCVEAGVPKIFLASTAAVYGNLKKCHESSDTITETFMQKLN